jgi:RNA polymerase sigma factor (sigma-70 family)
VSWARVRRYEYRDAWVARVATNLTIKSLRRAAPIPAPAAIDPSDETALRLALVDALGHLPKRQRETVALRYLADLSIDDVARTLGVSAGTVKQSVHRALRTLRDRVDTDLAIVTEETT